MAPYAWRGFDFWVAVRARTGSHVRYVKTNVKREKTKLDVGVLTLTHAFYLSILSDTYTHKFKPGCMHAKERFIDTVPIVQGRYLLASIPQ